MKLKTFLMSAGVAAITAGGALAQTETMTPAEDPMVQNDMATGDAGAPIAPTFTSVEEMTVGDVLTFAVYNAADDRIGDIDYVIDSADGPQAVVGVGGFLSLGEHTVPVALDEFTIRDDGMSFHLDTTKEAMEARPELDESTIEGLDQDVAISSLMKEPSMDGADSMDDPAIDETETMDDPAATDMETQDSSATPQ